LQVGKRWKDRGNNLKRQWAIVAPEAWGRSIWVLLLFDHVISKIETCTSGVVTLAQCFRRGLRVLPVFLVQSWLLYFGITIVHDNIEQPQDSSGARNSLHARVDVHFGICDAYRDPCNAVFISKGHL
jgi:hypothetical protein